jgi:hypothetical protein
MLRPDLRDEEGLAPDEEGLVMRDIDHVQREATRTLADMARARARGEAEWSGVFTLLPRGWPRHD